MNRHTRFMIRERYLWTSARNAVSEPRAQRSMTSSSVSSASSSFFIKRSSLGITLRGSWYTTSRTPVPERVGWLWLGEEGQARSARPEALSTPPGLRLPGFAVQAQRPADPAEPELGVGTRVAAPYGPDQQVSR